MTFSPGPPGAAGHPGTGHAGPANPDAAAVVARPAAYTRADGAASETEGATRYLPLAPVGGTPSRRATGGSVPQGVTSRAVKPFSLVGVTWNNDKAGLNGTAQVRTHSMATGAWSGWQGLENSDDAPDLDSPERAGGRVRGGTAPLWVGDADGVQVRVVPRAGTSARAPAPALPRGLRVDMVDPGRPAARHRAGPTTRAGAAIRSDDPYGDGGFDDYGFDGGFFSGILDDSGRAAGSGGSGTSAEPVSSGTNYTNRTPRPRIISRAGWGADEGLRERSYVYTGAVRAIIVHHTGTSNDYACKDVPSIIRGIYRYHVNSEGWRDIGYNFLVDKCGKIYEGRAGGVTKPVLGAHTLGFNADTSGIAVIGTYSRANPSNAAVKAVERLAAWKLSLNEVDADGHTVLTSTGSDKYRQGDRVRFATIAGHRDGFDTDCPGTKLYRKLGAIRHAAVHLQNW